MPADFSVGARGRRKRRNPRDPRPSGTIVRRRVVSNGSAPAPATAITRPIGGKPFARAQSQAARKVGQAQRALPKTPSPAVPRLAYPNQKQRETAHRLIINAQTRATGDTPARVPAYRQELRQDPRQREYLKTTRKYARSLDRRLLAHIGAQSVREAPPALPQVLPRADQALTRPILPMSTRDRQIAIGRAIVAGLPAPIRAKAGRPGSKISALGLNVPVPDVGKAIAAVTTLDTGDIGPRTFAKNVAGDVKALGTMPFVAGYELGASAVEGVGDHPFLALGGPAGLLAAVATTKRGQNLGKGLVQGVTESSPAALVTGHPGLAAERLRDHPLLEALNYAGAVGAVGRTAGAVSRAAGSTVEAGGVRGALARAGSTTRSPLALGDDLGAGVVEREFSKDLSRKAVQAAFDAHRDPLLDANGNVVTVERGGRQVPVLKATPREARRHAKREGDFDASRANATERLERDQAGKEHKVRGVRGKAARAVVQMVAEGTITSAAHFADDLRAHRESIAGQLDQEARKPGSVYSDRRDVKDAQERLALVDKVLGNPKAMGQAERIVAEGERHGRLLRAGDREMAAAGIAEDAQLNRAALSTTALEHLGARHVSKKQHARLEREARKTEDVARAKVAALADEQRRAAAARRVYERDRRNVDPALSEAGARSVLGPSKAAADKARRSEKETEAALRQAQAELKAAREHRIAVSGRDPERVVAHEDLQAAAAQARKRARDVQVELAALREKRARVAGRQEVQRGREGQAGPLRVYRVGDKRFESRAEAEKYSKANGGAKVQVLARTGAEARRTGARAQLDRRIEALEKEHRAARKAAREAGAAARASKMPPARAALRTSEGKLLANKDIENFLRSRGRDPGTVAHVPHRSSRDADAQGRAAFHRKFDPNTRPTTNGPARTGVLYRRGAAESSARLLQEHGVSQRVQVAKARAIDQAVSDHGMRHPAWGKAERGEKLTAYEQRVVDEGGMFTAKEARKAIRRFEADNPGRTLTAVRAHGMQMSDATIDAIRAGQAPGAMDSLGQRLLNDRFLREGDFKSGARNVVLMDGHYMDRLAAHLKPAGGFQRTLQMLNRFFRFAVLPQPRWLTGQFVEPYIVRLTTVGSGLNVFGLGLDIAAEVKTLRRMERSGDPAVRRAAQQLRAQQEGGLFIGGRGASVRRSASEIPGLGKVWGQVVQRLPVMQSFADILGMVPRSFFAANRIIEAGAQKAALGRSIRRDMQEFQGSWLASVRLGEKALDEAARGLTNTSTQARFMREQHKLLGKYEGYSPWMRNLIQGAMPFIPWTLNAARFVYWTMPTQRTVQTALLMNTSKAIQEDWAQQHKGVPPGGLGLAVPSKDGGWIDLARYTPYGLSGALAGGDIGIVTGQVFPQLQGAFQALEGRDPFGRDLRVSSGKPPTALQKVLIALNSLGEATIPYVSTARRLQEGGGTPYSDSTVFSPKVKPGTTRGAPNLGAAALRVFNPLQPVYLGKRGLTVASGPPPAPAEQRTPGVSRRQQELLDRAFDELDRASGLSRAQQRALDRAFGG